MKVVHNSLKEVRTKHDWLEKARELEQTGELQQAAKAYEQVIKADPVNELAYNRLMIVYRKEKEYKKELAVIKGGIRAFEDMYKAATRRAPDKKIMRLSKALLKATGLANKKGQLLYEPEPIGKWNKRKQLVEKRLK